VRGYHLQTSRFAHNRKVRSQSAAGQRARAGLPIFLIHKTREKDFSLRGSRRLTRKFAKRGYHRRDGPFGIAGAPPKKPAIFFSWREKIIRRIHRIQVRGEDDSTPSFLARLEASEQVTTPGEHRLQLHVQSRLCGSRSQKVYHPLFAGTRIVRRQKGRIDARQRYEFVQ
jgi:hypothetical protein